jgi:hypothetical protein
MSFPGSDGEIAIEIGGVPPAWFQPTVENIGRLPTLPPGWDSCKARKIEPACIASAMQTALKVMPGRNPGSHGRSNELWRRPA